MTQSLLNIVATMQDELLEFLKQRPQNIDDPLTIPPHLGLLSPQAYIDVAVDYVEQYAFDRTFTVYTLKTRTPSRFTPDCKWKIKARQYLRACIMVDRSGLASIDQAYDSGHQQQRFIHEVVFKQQFKLEELASEMLALVELRAVRSETKTASSVATPLDTGKPRDTIVKDKVRDRDFSCRMTGAARRKKRHSEQRVRASLQVAHGLPYGMGSTAFSLVTALTGIPANNWKADCVEDAFLTLGARPKAIKM
ncbi:hypothetical protein BT96DRAFT_1006590 [Gymnopus androsaceus JB14]|uniref:Uncharacterized protein n=1 Tax=Gymnopus androsaceus JB14 TaxID=1447944 RepID=A0A6A4GKJ3_9AGAR|nr:hypothetical protein BT96DRAFT_1006590 [Gymnopus androsaceus JB14]